MTDKEMKNILRKYTVSTDGEAKRQTVAAAVSASRSRFVPIGFGEFILNQLHYIKPQYWILCLAFIVSAPIVAAAADKTQTVLFISLIAPLLSAVSVPKITSDIHSGMTELESSMLYRASAVFSARILIYGVISTVCILFSSLFTSFVSGGFIWILLFESMMFTASSLAALLLSFFIRNEYAPFFISVAAAFICVFAFYSAHVKTDYVIESKFTFESYIGSPVLAAAAAALLVLLASTAVYIYKHYDFNGGLNYGN